MNKEYELRTMDFEQNEEDGNRLEGYAVVYNSRSANLGGFIEIIDEHAFDHVLAEDVDVRFLIDHDASKLLGRTTSGTLRMENRADGLWFSVELPDTQLGRDTKELVRRGDLTQCSFGFKCDEVVWDTGEEVPVRTVRNITMLRDLSAVTYPAFPETSVALRGLEELNKDEAAAQEELRELQEAKESANRGRAARLRLAESQQVSD